MKKFLSLLVLFPFLFLMSCEIISQTVPETKIQNDIDMIQTFLDDNASKSKSDSDVTYWIYEKSEVDTVSTMRERIKSGEAMKEYKETEKVNKELGIPAPTLETYSVETMLKNTVDLVKKDNGTDKDIEKAKQLLKKYPEWLPGDIGNIATGHITRGMTKEMVSESWGEPTTKKIMQTYEAWWYYRGTNKRDLIAFNPAGILFYFALDR